MPTANFDASLLTKRRRDFTIYSWNKTNEALVNAGLSIKREQPNSQLATVVTYRHEALANNTTNGCQCDAPTNPPGASGNTTNF